MTNSIAFNITFVDLFPASSDFTTMISTVATAYGDLTIFKDPNPKRLTPFTFLYTYLKNIFGDRTFRFINSTVAKNRFMTTFVEKYPALYVKQLTFVNKEYDTLVDKANREGTLTETWSNSDVITIARKNNEAFTNVGAIGDGSTIVLDPTKDKIYQKTGTDDSDTTTSTYGKVITRDDFNLFADMKNILDANISFGLAEFSQQFINLFRQFY